MNRLRGFGASASGGVWGGEVDDTAESGDLFNLLLLKLVSTGIGRACFRPVLSFFTVALLLRVVVSTGSGTNRRTFLALSSIGMAWKRIGAGGGEVSGMVRPD